MRPLAIFAGFAALAFSSTSWAGGPTLDLDSVLAGASTQVVGKSAYDDKERKSSPNKDVATQHRGRDYDNRRTVSCSSYEYRRKNCSLDRRIKSVRIVSRDSSRRCREGYSWGFSGSTLWVSDGCRGRFDVVFYDDRYGDDRRYRDRGYGDDRYGYGDDYRYGSYDDREYIYCESSDYNRRTCQIRGSFRSVRLHDRKSRASCHEGKDWGTTSRGVWVKNGCRAVFSYKDRNSRGRDYGYGDRDYRDRDYRDYDRPRARGVKYIGCASRNGRRSTCEIYGKFSNVYLHERKSSSRCREGRDWGTTKNGVWVANGCRAVFAYRSKGRDYGYRDDDRKYVEKRY